MQELGLVNYVDTVLFSTENLLNGFGISWVNMFILLSSSEVGSQIFHRVFAVFFACIMTGPLHKSLTPTATSSRSMPILGHNEKLCPR